MRRTIASSILCLAVGFAAAGCGGSDQSSATTDVAAQGQQAAGAGQGGSGLVSAVSGSTAQVQGQASQVAVSWTDSTTFSKQVSAAASDVTVGSCVVVSSDQSAEAESSDTVAAVTVRVTQAVDGSCVVAGGGTGDRGNRPGGNQQGDAADRPTDRPTGTPQGGGGRAGGGLATGEVTAISDAGFTVASQRPGADDEATTLTVTTSADTTYTAAAAAAAADVKVGVCVISRGETDDTGALTATSIAVSDPVDGECAVGGARAGRPAAQS